MTFGQKIFDLYKNLDLPSNLPNGVEVMNPYANTETNLYFKNFLDKYFSDNNNRIFIFGINPGRFGAGLTGIAFTDPVALSKYCNIPNDLGTKKELSAEFVYEFINSWGGVEKFYSKFFMAGMSPLGFIKNGKNYNYYDDKDLLSATMPYIKQNLQKHIEVGGQRHAAIVFGSGKNLKVIEKLNQENNFFVNIYALDHPRFIMQYKRRFIAEYLNKYHETFTKALENNIYLTT